jgi:hypothetical protein
VAAMISEDHVLPIIAKNKAHTKKFIKEIREINDILNDAMHISTNVPMLLKGAAALLQNHISHIEFHQRLELENNINRLWIVMQGERHGIAWNIIYNFEIQKNGLSKLIPNCNRILFAVTHF